MKPMTARQYTAACFLALLSPMIRVLPGMAAALGGRLFWLGPLVSFVFLFFFGLFVCYLLKKGHGDPAALTLHILGPCLGRIVLLLWSAGLLLYAGFILRVGADRLIVTVYPQSSPWVFCLFMLLLGLVGAMGTIRALGRVAVILRALMLLVLGAAIVFSLRNLDFSMLLPREGDGVRELLLGAIPMADVGAFVLCFCPLGPYAGDSWYERRYWLPWLGVMAALCFFLCIVAAGTFGPTLTGRLSYPFFVMVRDLSFFDPGARMEAFIVAMWVFSDFVLCALLLRSSHQLLRHVFSLPDPEAQPFFSLKGGRWLLAAQSVPVLAVCLCIAPDAAALQRWSETLIPVIYASMCLGGPALLWLAGKLRRRI